MPKDATLDRLKTEQDRAFERKQSAWQAQDNAWKQRESAKGALDSAHRSKQHAYDVMNAAWQDFQNVRASLGPRIESLNSQQDTAYQRMTRAFEDASSAHARKDGAAAKSYSNDGHSYKAESQRCVAERRRLVEEIRSARARHEATKPAFEREKSNFAQVKNNYDRAKANHQSAQDAFKRAKAEFEKAKSAFQQRLATVRSEADRRKADRRSLAQQAGVPSQYLDNVYVSNGPDGITNIYFGGIGKPDGEGHGHYAMNSAGTVTYRREPFDPHGSQNFTEPRTTSTHKGGFGEVQHGFIDGKPVTFSEGWGTNAGHTLLADGHLQANQFRESANHNHYGPGDDPSNNAKDIGKYTGSGA